jgi:hypothetical protein
LFKKQKNFLFFSPSLSMSSDRQQLLAFVNEQQETWNSAGGEPAHNFIEIAHELSAYDEEIANYYYELNDLNNDAKHYNGEHFDNVTNEAK